MAEARDPEAILRALGKTFERARVAYFVVGSVASSLYGAGRSTMDVDVVADLNAEHVPVLVEALGEQFYLDENTIPDAIARRGSFNLVHKESFYKVDVFLPKQRAFDKGQLARRVAKLVGSEDRVETYFASAEDTILSKLEWYRAGGETSERQWQDVLSILKVQEGRLDIKLLRKWALRLQVLDLLERALEEAG